MRTYPNLDDPAPTPDAISAINRALERPENALTAPLIVGTFGLFHDGLCFETATGVTLAVSDPALSTFTTTVLLAEYLFLKGEIG